MIHNKNILFFIVVFLTQAVYSQIDCKKYTKKYIPKDINETFSYFECNWSKEDLGKFKSNEEKDAVISLHRNYGRLIRNNWGLWKRKGKLAEFFVKLGIFHPDDMSAIIFTSFHRKLNDKPIELKKQIDFYKNYWKRVGNKQRKKYLVDFNKFKIKDTISFKYLRGFISNEQKKLYKSGKCIATGIVVNKRESDFYLKVKLINSCDKKGLYTGLDAGKPKRKIMKRDDEAWIYYNDWKPKFNN